MKQEKKGLEEVRGGRHQQHLAGVEAEFKEIGKAALEFEDDHLSRKLDEAMKVVEDIDEKKDGAPQMRKIN